MDNVREITSLDDLKDLPVKDPDPIEMVWEQGGKICRMKIDVKRPGKTPSDYASLRVEYLHAKRKAETPVFDTPNGLARYPDEGMHNRLIRERCIRSPAFLKNEGIDKSDVLAPEFWAGLDLKLLPVAGIDGDFFYDWETLQTPKGFLLKQIESLAKLEASSRTKSLNDVPIPPQARSTTPSSRPTTNGPGRPDSSEGSSDSKTPSGSDSPLPPSPTPNSSHPPTRPLDTSSVSAPSSPERSASPTSPMEEKKYGSDPTSPQRKMKVKTIQRPAR